MILFASTFYLLVRVEKLLSFRVRLVWGAREGGAFALFLCLAGAAAGLLLFK